MRFSPASLHSGRLRNRTNLFGVFQQGFPLTCLQSLANRSVADMERGGNLPQAQAGGLQLYDAFQINILAGTAESLALRTRISDSRIDSLTN
jgi:hypothetical protein